MTINFLIAKYILLVPGHNEIWIASRKKLVWVGLEQILVDLLLNSNRKWKEIVLAGSEQILVDLLLNSNRKWKEIGLGWLRADFGWFAIEF